MRYSTTFLFTELWKVKSNSSRVLASRARLFLTLRQAFCDGCAAEFELSCRTQAWAEPSGER